MSSHIFLVPLLISSALSFPQQTPRSEVAGTLSGTTVCPRSMSVAKGWTVWQLAEHLGSGPHLALVHILTLLYQLWDSCKLRASPMSRRVATGKQDSRMGVPATWVKASWAPPRGQADGVFAIDAHASPPSDSPCSQLCTLAWPNA